MQPRRAALALPALLVAGCAGAARPVAAPQLVAESGPGLHARAAAKGLSFGTAVASRHLDEPDTVAALRADCGLVVAEWEQKWSWIEPVRGQRDFTPGDRIARFAQANGMALRGHTLLWHQSNPRWLAGLDAPETRGAVAEHIAQTGARWRGRVTTWDVLNEAVHIADGRPDWLRRTRLLNVLGPDHIAQAFHQARAADPAVRLAYNDYGCEHANLYGRRKRLGVLSLLRALKAAGAPVQVLGIQAHLTADQPFAADEWRGFLAEVAALGLTIELTELDVNDAGLPAEPGPRDAMAADLVRRFLDASLAEPAVRSVVTWNLSDRHSWIGQGRLPQHRRADGATARPLPYDARMRRKPMWSAIAAAFDAAPRRPPLG
jgi:endo-1,4-beta-xylanase